MAAVILPSRLTYSHHKFILYCIVKHTHGYGSIYLIFKAWLRLRFPDGETNLGQRRPVPSVCRILCAVCTRPVKTPQWPNRGFVTVWFTVVLRDFLLSYAIHVGVAVFWIVLGQNFRPEGWPLCVRDGYGAFLQPKFECGSCQMLVFKAFGSRQNFFCLYHNPSLL